MGFNSGFKGLSITERTVQNKSYLYLCVCIYIKDTTVFKAVICVGKDSKFRGKILRNFITLRNETLML